MLNSIHGQFAKSGTIPNRFQTKRCVKSKAGGEDVKDILFDNYSRARLQAGINKVADAVAVTMGPRGRNVVLESSYGTPQVINDGVTIARAVNLQDNIENTGAQLIKEVSGRTNDSAGDGTTTAAVLAQYLIQYGLQAVTSGANPIVLKRGIDKTCNFLVEQMKIKCRQVKGKEDIKNVASISAGNDEFIGDMIADALDRVGADGVLSIESSKSFETTVEVQEGMQFDRGYISPQFITNVERMLVEFENARVLITDQIIENIKDIVPILEKVSGTGNPLLIIAEDVRGEALATLVVNKMRGIMKVAAVKAPAFGERRKSVLQDIAIVTGGEFIGKDLGMNVVDTELDQMGKARRVTLRDKSCTIIADQGSKDDIDARVAQLKLDLSTTQSTYDTEKLSERIAKLTGGVAVIKVGAATEAELEDRKLRVEDAKNATFAAVEEGVVAGGGAALLHLSELIDEFKETLDDPEEKQAAEIIKQAIREPTRRIAQNSGVEGEVIVQKLLGQGWEVGYNAMEDEIQDLYATGVIDPTKVVRSALQNACSIAGIMLTTQAVMVVKQKADASALGFGPEGMPSGMSV